MPRTSRLRAGLDDQGGYLLGPDAHPRLLESCKRHVTRETILVFEEPLARRGPVHDVGFERLDEPMQTRSAQS